MSRGRAPRAPERNSDQPQRPQRAWRGQLAPESEDDPTVGTSQERRADARRLLGDLLRPYRRVLVWLAIVIVVENVARLAVPKMVQLGIDNGVPALTDADDAGPLITVLVALVVAVAIQATTRIWFLNRSGVVSQKVLLEVRRRLFRHFQRLDVGFHDRYTSGRVVSRSTNDVEAIQEMTDGGFDGLITAALTMVGTAILLLSLDWRLGLVCLVGFPVLILLTRWFSRESMRSFRAVRERAALLIVHFVETMTGMRAVQAYRREPRNQEIFDDVADDYRVANESTFRLFAIFMPSLKLIGNLTTGAVILYGGWRVFHGEMTVGVLTAFLIYLRMFFEPMEEVGQFYNSFQSASSALEKIAGVLAQRPAVVDPEHPVEVAGAGGRVDFDHVRFSYDEATVVLPDLDLHIPAGQTVALVGTTGAGKTTIAKLMARFYDPVEGGVLLDGTDLRTMTQADLRRHVVMVTQENVMFAGTIGDNIRFGRPEASPEEVVAAARAVGADRFVEAMPDGFDTDVAKDGGRLSAGQRQLIAFARAFLADPAVLILDEATSSLDIPSERLVQHALETVLADRTALVIAHRLSTVEVADRVLVLEHGQILEDGSPAELIGRSGGRYAELHDRWVASLA